MEMKCDMNDTLDSDDIDSNYELNSTVTELL